MDNETALPIDISKDSITAILNTLEESNGAVRITTEHQGENITFVLLSESIYQALQLSNLSQDQVKGLMEQVKLDQSDELEVVDYKEYRDQLFAAEPIHTETA